MTNFSSAFLQNRQRVLSGANTEDEEKRSATTQEKVQADFSRFGESFQAHRQQVISAPARVTQTPQQQVDQLPVETPAKQTPEQPGFFQRMKDALVNAVSQSFGSPNIGFGLPGLKPEIQKKIEEKVTKFAIDIARSIPRSGVSTALTANEFLQNKMGVGIFPKGTTEVTPGAGDNNMISRAEKILLGDEKIRDFQGTGEAFLKDTGQNKEIAQKYGFATGAAFAALDLWPSFPGKKQIVETIAKETSPKVIKELLQTKVFKNISDETATALAKKLSTVNKTKDVQDVIDYFTKVDRTQLSGKALSTSSEDILKAREDAMVKNTAGEKKLTSFDAPDILEARKNQGEIISTHTINTPERQALRTEIAQKVYGQGAAKKERRVDIVMGPPAAGKSTVLVDPLAKEHGSLVIDADVAKKHLPEFKGGKYAGAVHQESSDIVHAEVLQKAVVNGDNIVFPIVGKTIENVRSYIDEFNKAGYEVHLHLNDLPPEKAAARAVQRYRDTGRFTDPNYVLNEVGLRPSQNYDILKLEKGVKSYEKFSNDVPKGQSPILVEQSPNYPRRRIRGEDSTQLPEAGQSNPTEAIERTAKEIKEKPSVVKRVTESIKKAGTRLIEYIQNEHEETRRLVSRKDVKLDDVSDPYLKATLYYGKVATKISKGKDIADQIVKDAKKTADTFKTDLKTIRKQVNDYLYFSHAPERNAALGEKAAGITTKEAEDGLKALESLPQFEKIKELATTAKKLNERVLDVLKDSGVISKSLHETLRAKYKNHVPLNRIFEETEDVGDILSGRGFDVRSTGIKRAKGSEREVDDILGNIVANYEQAVLRAEKNVVDQATLAFARNNKDILGDLLVVKKPKAIGTTFDGKIIKEKTQDPTILQLFEDGKPIWIKINDKHLAASLRSIGREKIPGIFRGVAAFTRLYSGLATRFNPEFAFPNKIRDLQETAVYLASQKGVGFKGTTKAVARDLFQENTAAILDYLRGGKSKGAKLYEEMKELGGTTGGFGLSTREQVTLELEDLEKLATSKSKRVADNLIKYVDNWNTIFEDSTRLSVYRQALDQKLSKERAAFLAKEASINFNRMGKGGPIINALWMFSNASIQGSLKTVRALKNPKVLGATVLTIGASVAAVNEWNDRVDPDWRDKVTKWDRLNGLPIVIPSLDGQGVKYITIPVSWGVKPMKVMADYAYDAMAGQGFDAKKMVADTLTSMLEAYNPVGGTDLASAIMPTIGDIPLEISRNEAWSGTKIKPDFDPNAPADIQYFDSLKKTKTGQVAISISELLQSKGGIAISPADIKYAFDGYTGGAGRSISKTINTITGFLKGEPPPVDEYPLLSRFYRERTQEEVGAGAGGETEDIKKLLEGQSRDRFKIKQEAEDTYNGLKGKSKDEIRAKLLDIANNNPELLNKLLETMEENALGLTYSEKLVKQLGVDNGERAKYIWSAVQKMKTGKEKGEYIANLYKKKIITGDVVDQLSVLATQK